MSGQTRQNPIPDSFETDDDFGAYFHRKLGQRYGFERAVHWTRRKRRRPAGTEANTALWDRMRRVEERMQASVPPSLRKRIEIVRTREVNAFIAPGRFIYVTLPLLRSLPSDDATALVVGHEIAHGELGHLMAFSRMAEWKRVPAGDTAFALHHLLQRFVSSPANERDADAYGLDLALQAGYDGERCLAAFEVIERHIVKLGLGGLLVDSPKAMRRQPDSPFGAWRAEAEVWLYEHLFGYPAIQDRREALSDRLARHVSGSTPMLLPGSRRSVADANAGFIARRDAIDAELGRWRTSLDALGSKAAEQLRSDSCRRLVSSLDGTTAGIDGATAREAAAAVTALREVVRKVNSLYLLYDRAQETRRHLSSNSPPRSALEELTALLFPARVPSPQSGSAGVSPAGGNISAQSETPVALIQELSGIVTGAVKTLSHIESGWTNGEALVASRRQDLELLTAACQALQLDPEDELSNLVDLLASVDRQYRSDPLAPPAGGERQLTADIEAARRRLGALVASRRQSLL